MRGAPTIISRWSFDMSMLVIEMSVPTPRLWESSLPTTVRPWVNCSSADAGGSFLGGSSNGIGSRLPGSRITFWAIPLTCLRRVDKLQSLTACKRIHGVFAMAESQRPAMSDAEREVLKVLWDHGPLAVREVLERDR